MGDGDSFVVLQIPPEKIEAFSNSLATSPEWKPLPLPVYLAENDFCFQPDRDLGEIPVANVTGYYLLRDRQEEYNRLHNRHRFETEIPICERWSSNLFFSLFNDKTGVLYLYDVDT